MRTLVLAQLMMMVAVAACDDVAFDVDGGTVAIDASPTDADGGADPRMTGDVALPAIATPARMVPDGPALLDLTRVSGRLGVIVGPGEGPSVGPIARLGTRGQGATVLHRQHRATDDEQALLGSAVRLYDADGTTCAATVTALVDVALVDEARGRGTRSLRTLWDVAREHDGVTLIAELSTTGCAAPLLAEDGALAARIATAPTIVTGPDVTAALTRLRALPTFTATARDYQASEYVDDRAPPDWSEDADAIVTRFDLAGVGYETAELTREGGCGDFTASVFAIWQVGADGARRLVLDSQEGAPAGYDLAFVDGATGLPAFAVASPLAAVDEEPEGCGC